ncbi:MAG: NUDIX hydrolase, partial [Pseudonocardiaceae bacterium]
EPSLTDEGHQADPSASLARLIEIAAEPGGPAVVCSQGGAIPELVRTLADDAGLPLSRVPREKGSYWGLFFGDGPSGQPVLLAADYYDDALT